MRMKKFPEVRWLPSIPIYAVLVPFTYSNRTCSRNTSVTTSPFSRNEQLARTITLYYDMALAFSTSLNPLLIPYT